MLRSSVGLFNNDLKTSNKRYEHLDLEIGVHNRFHSRFSPHDVVGSAKKTQADFAEIGVFHNPTQIRGLRRSPPTICGMHFTPTASNLSLCFR